MQVLGCLCELFSKVKKLEEEVDSLKNQESTSSDTSTILTVSKNLSKKIDINSKAIKSKGVNIQTLNKNILGIKKII